MDIDALQDNLYSQDFLTNTVDALKLENETIKKETDALKRRLDQQAQRLTVTRKECHRRRLLLLAQQQLMDSGPQSYHQCPHCPKAFINASFLNAHLYRRHVEVVTALQAIDLNQDHIDRSDKGGNLQKEKPAIDKSSGLTSNLEHQIQEVLGHIKTQPPSLPPTQLASAIVQTVEVNEGSGDYHPPTLPPAPSPTATWKKRTAELERQLQEERERMRELEERNRAWQTSVAEQHRADVEHVREMFEVELRNLREENLQTQKELIQLRLKGANVSTFGDLEDDVPAQLERQVRSLEASPKRFKHRQDSETAHGTTKIVHIVEDNTCPVESTEQKLEKPLRTGKHDKGDVKSKDFNIELRIDPTEGVRPYKEQLEQLRQDPNALKRLRKEVEALLMEQLIDHDIQADARGLPRGKFNGTIDTLGQERQQLERKHPTFAEIRASLSRQVDRMALVALHSKRERREPLSGDGDGAASSSFKKPRASRSSERSISARPTSGRPASLTSITPTLSPIAERPRLAMVSPAMRRPNEAHSTQSLFEESEEEEVDSDVTAPVHK
uniref:C2H2-type domain-containing protein n=1 Tax=Mesocestoides corti TaxID=53468 RepID=A0A5K3FQ18_MESCO